MATVNPNPAAKFPSVSMSNGTQVQPDHPAVGDALAKNERALSVRRENADGNPKWIKASIKTHTDPSTHETNFTQVVDDVFSQKSEGDCLPPELQAQRAELKSRISYGGEDGGAAAAELAALDEAIVHDAQEVDASGIEPITYQENRFQEALQQINDSFSDAAQKLAEEGMTMPVMPPMDGMTEAMAKADPNSQEFQAAMDAMNQVQHELDDINSQEFVSAEDVNQLEAALAELNRAASNMPPAP